MKIAEKVNPIWEPYKGLSNWEKEDLHWVFQRTEWSVTVDGKVYSGCGACIRIPYKHRELFPKNLWGIYFPIGTELTNSIIKEAKRLKVFVK